MINGELIIDNFAGGGGASTGLEMATGVSVDIAINHDPRAIAMHKANHPGTKHYCESVWDVDPAAARLILKFTGRKIFKNSYKKETFTDVQKITVEWLESEAAEND